MKRFIGLVRKEFYHIFRDRRSLFILFGMPIAQILLFGFAITNEISQVDIAIYDQARDLHSKEVINKIAASDYFTVRYIESQSDIEQIFKEGQVKSVLVFQSNFSQELLANRKSSIQIINDATDPNMASTISNYLNAIIRSYQSELNQQAALPYQIDIQTRMAYNEELKSVYMFVPGVMTIILMLVSAMMTSISISREKELGTMEVLLVSPIAPAQVILGKVIPYVFLSLINAVIIILLNITIFQMPIKGSYILLAFETVLFIVTSLSLGILISTVSQTQQTAMMISLMGLMLPTILLSGFIFPISSMPLPLQVISNIIPAKWFVIILKDIMHKGVGITLILKETLILLGMTTFFIVLSIKKYKIRLE